MIKIVELNSIGELIDFPLLRELMIKRISGG